VLDGVDGFREFDASRRKQKFVRGSFRQEESLGGGQLSEQTVTPKAVQWAQNGREKDTGDTLY
jgi:hypothetical protein